MSRRTTYFRKLIRQQADKQAGRVGATGTEGARARADSLRILQGKTRGDLVSARCPQNHIKGTGTWLKTNPSTGDTVGEIRGLGKSVTLPMKPEKVSRLSRVV